MGHELTYPNNLAGDYGVWLNLHILQNTSAFRSWRLLHQKPIENAHMYLQSTNTWYIHIFAARVLAGARWASTRCWSCRISWITLDHSQSSEQAPMQKKRAVHFLKSVNSLYKTISAKEMFDLFDGVWGTWNFAVLISFSALRFRLHPEFPDRCKASTNVLPLPTDTHTQTHNTHTRIHTCNYSDTYMYCILT